VCGKEYTEYLSLFSEFAVQPNLSDPRMQTVDGPLTAAASSPVNPLATMVMIKPMHFSLTEYISYDVGVSSGKRSSPSDLLDIKVCYAFRNVISLLFIVIFSAWMS